MSCPCRSGWLVSLPVKTGRVVWEGQSHRWVWTQQRQTRWEKGLKEGWFTFWREPGSLPGPCQRWVTGWTHGDSRSLWQWCHYRQFGQGPEPQRSCWDPCLVGGPEQPCEGVLECTGAGTCPPQRPGPCWCSAGFVAAATRSDFSWWAFWEVCPLSRWSASFGLKSKQNDINKITRFHR